MNGNHLELKKNKKKNYSISIVVQNTSQMWTKQTKREEPPPKWIHCDKRGQCEWKKKKTNKTPQKTITRVFCV